MKAIALFFLLTVFTFNGFGQNELVGPDNVGELMDQKVSLHVSANSLKYVLGAIAKSYGIPMGLETSPEDLKNTKISIDVREKSLKEVIDLLIKQEPRYKWEIIDGVINFTPTHNRDEFLSDLLDLGVSRIEHPKTNDADGVRKAILRSPEVVVFLNSKGVEHSRWAMDVSFVSLFSNSPIDLTSSDVTLREYLNKVVKETDRKTWVVEMVGEKKNKVLISF